MFKRPKILRILSSEGEVKKSAQPEMRRRVRLVLDIRTTVVVTLVFGYWIFLRPLASFPSELDPADCEAIKPGMSLQQVVKLVDANSVPAIEEFHSHILKVEMATDDTCQIDFDNDNKAVSTKILGNTAQQ